MFFNLLPFFVVIAVSVISVIYFRIQDKKEEKKQS